jgi:hypothetical protein
MAKDAIDTFINKISHRVVKLKKPLDRNTQAIPCPICNGFCDTVERAKAEIRVIRDHMETLSLLPSQSCSRAFKCRLCKVRIIAGLEAPEMGD